MTQDDEASDEPENPFALNNEQNNEFAKEIHNHIEENKEENLKQNDISFKGFDKYAKFVEFEEKLFE